MTLRGKHRRGYPVAILIGLKETQAVLWRVYSQAVKLEREIALKGFRSDPKSMYNFYESTIDALRPFLKEGVKSIVIASPARTGYSKDMLKHIKEHHSWLTQGQSTASFAEMEGSATTFHEITSLSRTIKWKHTIEEAAAGETETLIELMDKRLNSQNQEPLVLYSLEEIEDKILNSWITGKPKPEYILVLDLCLEKVRIKNRVHRLMQIAINRSVKVRVISSETPAGKRLLQFGGIVGILSQSA